MKTQPHSKSAPLPQNLIRTQTERRFSENSAEISKYKLIYGRDVVLRTHRSPVLHRQSMLASSCSQLEAIVVASPQQPSCTPEFQICPPTPSHQGALPPSSAPPTLSSIVVGEQENRTRLWMQQRAPRSEKGEEGSPRDSKGCLQLVRSHSEPGFGSSTDTGRPSMAKRNQSSDVYLNILECKLSPL